MARDTVLITGISGNLGRTLARLLHRSEKVAGLDRRPNVARAKYCQKSNARRSFVRAHPVILRLGCWTVSACSCYNSCMPNLRSPEWALYILQILVSAILAVLFLQSGLDKVIDRKGNRAYLDEHFAKSPLGGTVGPMLLVVTILEVSAGALSAVGCILLLITRNATVAFFGALIAAINLIALFFGQRVSKDYAGAAALVPYFLLALTAIFVLAEH